VKALHLFLQGAFVTCMNPSGCNSDTAWQWYGGTLTPRGTDQYTTHTGVEELLHYHYEADVPCDRGSFIFQVYADKLPSPPAANNQVYACSQPAGIACGSEFNVSVNGVPVSCGSIHHSRTQDPDPTSYNCYVP